MRFSFRPTLGFCVHVTDGLHVDSERRDPTVMTVQMPTEQRTVAEQVLASAFAGDEQGWYELPADDCRRRVTAAVRLVPEVRRGAAAEDWAEVAEHLDEVERRTGEPGMVSITWW